ncbi:DUF5627 domain-containing protein [Niabella sp. CC-SYL272]|uniref:DUF5627 domain-containing protein n=1 Tax=Niabella agricola TaxID=2891571 RepID=UPI001F468F62|nr:DUF5627 domain-containing protein [Niabella agricola]MCF3107716.1 DUF5627 domain-containing protein [Niabella agricola]
MNKKIILPFLLLAVFTSCNKDRDFPDYNYQTVYFPYQYPVRTITLGEDLTVDNTLDNRHKFQVYAAMGGAYKARNDINVSFVIDEALVGTGMLFSPGGNAIQPLPAHYYQLAGNRITIPKGALAGGVEVQLTDAFFNDPGAVKNTYVLPVRITGLVNADSILSSRNFTLYAVKFVNEWHGNYLRRGTDMMTGDVNKTVTRHALYVEYDEVNKLTTRSLNELEFPVTFKDHNNNSFSCTLVLKFDNSGNCTIASGTTGFTVAGTGAFIKKAEKNSWGNKDRDALYLNYQVGYKDITVGSGADSKMISGSIATKDTLVMRDRAVTMETFTPVVK